MGKVFQFVRDFGEGGELVALEALNEHLSARCRVIDAVDVVVRVAVEVVVFEQQIPAWDTAYVADR